MALSERRPLSFGPVVAATLWLALLASLIEIVVLGFDRRMHPMLRLSDDFLWTVPVALMAVAVGATVLCAFIGRVWRRAPFALALWMPATLLFLGLLMLVPRLSHYAAAALAAGLAVQATRMALGDPARTRRVIRRSSPALLVCLALAASVVRVSSPRARSRQPAAGTPAGSTRPPSVLLITLDTVRAANLSLYGYSRTTTPTLERFAERGVVFDNAFAAAPWTLPSHASLFTGRWPHELSADYETPLDGTFPTLAEYLAGRGYATAGFVANLGYCSAGTGLARGFEHYEDYPRSLGQLASNSTLIRKVADNFNLRRLLRNDQHLNRVSAADLNQRVLTWVSSHATSPFFVFVNYFDAHEPYLPPPPFDRRFGPGRTRGQLSPLHRWLWDVSVGHRKFTPEELGEEMDAYDGSLAYLDEQLASLLDGLADRHLLDETVVLVTADHGEEFGEHAVFDHGYTLYRQALQVPLVIVAPGRAPGARRVSAPVSLRAVAATIVDILGLGAGAPFPGESLASFWGTPVTSTGSVGSLTIRQPGSDALLSEVSRASGQPDWFPASRGAMKALIYQGFHYIRNGDGREELYDMNGDPAEHTDIASMPVHQQRLAESRALLKTLQTLPSSSPPGMK